MLILDRALSVLMILGAAGHTYGSLTFYHDQPHPRFWALNGTLVILFVAAINLLRSARPGDHALAWLAAGCSALYVVVAIGFGLLIGNVADPRALGFALVALGLTFFSLRAALGV